MTTLTDDFLSSKDESSYCIYVPNMKINKEGTCGYVFSKYNFIFKLL